jgi:hypothetical protein
MTRMPPKYTPAEAKPLTRDEAGELPQGSFSHASVVGMLLYLAGHLRCYLKARKDEGLILDLSGKLTVDDYPEADFAGLYRYKVVTDPANVKSRMGFLITVSDYPVVWASKLQTETALSTMEAEIIALAHCCRELFPVVDIVKELGKVVGLAAEDLVYACYGA